MNKINNELVLHRKQNRKNFRGRTLKLSGTDFIKVIKVYPKSSLINGIRKVAEYYISPGSFPKTRLELLSKAYQFYRFNDVVITFTSQLPTAVNGIYIAYLDTDPLDDNEGISATDILRIARSHQGSHQGKIRDNWVFKLPIRRDDQKFFTGSLGDKRFTHMGKLHIYQVGVATKFDGTPLEEILDAGILNIEWSVTFSNPQLQPTLTVYDGVSYKNVNRVSAQGRFYKKLQSKNVPAGFHIPGTRFRVRTLVLPKAFWPEKGSYLIYKIPNVYLVNQALKAIHSTVMPHSFSKGTTSLGESTRGGGTTVEDFKKFVYDAFQIIKGGIEVAKTVYDVVSVVLATFVKTNAITTNNFNPHNTLDTLTTPNQTKCDGQMIAYYDGQNDVRVDEFYEFGTIAQAASTDISVRVTYTYMCVKIKNEINKDSNTPIQSNLPTIKPLDQSYIP